MEAQLEEKNQELQRVIQPSTPLHNSAPDILDNIKPIFSMFCRFTRKPFTLILPFFFIGETERENE